eukprot:309867-Rhodomonas_salina.1
MWLLPLTSIRSTPLPSVILASVANSTLPRDSIGPRTLIASSDCSCATRSRSAPAASSLAAPSSSLGLNPPRSCCVVCMSRAFTLPRPRFKSPWPDTNCGRALVGKASTKTERGHPATPHRKVQNSMHLGEWFTRIRNQAHGALLTATVGTSAPLEEPGKLSGLERASGWFVVSSVCYETFQQISLFSGFQRSNILVRIYFGISDKKIIAFSSKRPTDIPTNFLGALPGSTRVPVPGTHSTRVGTYPGTCASCGGHRILNDRKHFLGGRATKAGANFAKVVAKANPPPQKLGSVAKF